MAELYTCHMAVSIVKYRANPLQIKINLQQDGCFEISSKTKQRAAGNWVYVLPDRAPHLCFPCVCPRMQAGELRRSRVSGYDFEACLGERALDFFDLRKIARFHRKLQETA